MKKILITRSLNEKKIQFNWIKFSFRFILVLPILLSISTLDKLNAQIICANELPSNYVNLGDCQYPTSNINLTIPLYFHEVYSPVTSNPTMNIAQLETLVDEINNKFSGYNVNVQFVLAKFDENGVCFDGFKSHDFREQAGKIYQDIAGEQIEDIYPDQEDREYLLSHYFNVWVTSDGLYGGSPQAFFPLDGFGVFPSEIVPFPNKLNGNNIFIKKSKLDFVSFCHEVGHNFGLFHIFEGGGCSAINDCLHGDGIETIPSCQRIDIYNILDCDNYTICSSNTAYPVENFMSYAYVCATEFVEEQYHRMAKYTSYFEPLSSSNNLAIVLGGSTNSSLANPFTFSQNQTGQLFKTSINSVVYVDGDIVFSNCDFFFGPSSKLIVKSGSSLTISESNLSSSACSALLWDGIIVEDGAELIVKDNSIIEKAYIGIHSKSNSTLSIESSLVRDCYVGVKLNEKAAPPNLPIPLDIDILKFSNVQILGSSNLLFHLEHSTSEGSYAGIQIDDVSLAPVVSGNATINTIQGFKYGILSKGSTLLAENMELQKNTWGVKSSSYTKKYFPVILKNINIFDCTVGVDVDQASTYINDLNFWTNDIGLKLNRCYGGEVINCNQTLTRIPNVGFKILNSSHIQFDNNYIIGEQDNLFSNCHNLKMNNCTIDHFTFNAVRKSSFSENTFEVLNNEAHGIIAGGNDNVFECNYYFSLVGDALVNDNSPDNTFRCNEFEGYAAGMVFEGNSVGTDFEANSFNSSNIGLYLKGWDSQIGLQVDKGNIFSGFFDEIGAKNENPDYFFSLIINNNNLFFNPSHSPNDWFLQNSQESAAFCGNSCINGAGDDFVSWEGEQYSKCLDSLFYGSKFSSLSTKAKWNLLFIMYRKNYLRDTTLLNNRECLKSILRYFKNSNLHRAVFAYDVLVSPQPLSDLNLRIAITDLSDGYVNDEVNTFDIDDFKDITDTYLSDNLHNLDLYYQILDSLGINFIPFLNEEDPVSKVGVVFPILNKYLNGESISSFEVSELLSIAESCARDVGPSKYYAMSTLQSLDFEFQNTDCYVDNNYRISIEQNQLIEKAINFQLLDIGGRAIINATEEIDISTLQIPFGLYILSTRFEDGTIKGEVKIKL